MTKIEKYVSTLILSVVMIGVGYGWRIHHERLIQKTNQSQAEKDLRELEQEFIKASDNPKTFHIFNHRFEVYPIKGYKNRFHYRRIK